MGGGGIATRVRTVLKSGIAKGAAGSFGLKVVSLGISFVTNVVLARQLGATDYGAYVYALAWITFLGIPASLGLPEYLIREVAIYRAKEDWSHLRGLLHWANGLVLVLSLGTGAIAAAVIAALDLSPQLRLIFWLMLLVMPLASLTGLRQGTMKGLNRVVVGDFPELLVRPTLFLGLVGLGILLLGQRLTAVWVMGIYGVTVALAFGVGAWLLYRSLPEAVHRVESRQMPGLWFRATLPFLLIVAMFVVNQQTDVMMLGLLQGTDAAGIYTVVGRGTQLIQFALMAISSATGPTLAGLVSREDWSQLKQVLTNSSRLLLGSTLAIALTLMLLGRWFLAIFGPEFVAGYPALIILGCGYLMSAPLELAGLLLLMSGHERETAIGTGMTATLNVIFNALLIPRWGLAGAALATSLSMVIRGSYFMIRAHQRLHMVPNPLASGSSQSS